MAARIRPRCTRIGLEAGFCRTVGPDRVRRIGAAVRQGEGIERTRMVAENSKSPFDTRWTAADRRLDRAFGGMELGNEPPIEANGDAHSPTDHRRISIRWFCGTVLTGLAGATLIGGAVIAALEKRTQFAEAPEFFPRQAAVTEPVNERKGDRLVRPVDIVAARHTYRVPTTVKVGRREIVRMRTFTRVATTMLLSPAGFGRDVPPFNPLKLLGGATQRHEPEPQLDLQRADADVSFLSHDLGKYNLASEGPSLSGPEIQAQINEHLKNALSAKGNDKPLPLPPQLLLMRTSRANLAQPKALTYASVNGAALPSAFKSIQVKMVPENVTLIHKHRATASRDADVITDNTQKLVVTKAKDSLASIMKRFGATRAMTEGMVRAFGMSPGHRVVREGQKLKITFLDLDGSGRVQIAKIAIYNNETRIASIAMDDNGIYRPVEQTDPLASQQVASRAKSTGTMRLYNAFYETALKHRIPRDIIDDLVRIFANNVDFNRAVSGGDAFEVFFTPPQGDNGVPELLYASVTARGQKLKYYRFRTGKKGAVEYFDEDGQSSRKFLIRKPLNGGKRRSGFGMRRHPILRYARMHTGVDWAAKTGTPIVAAGNGTVIKAKRGSGYGNRIEIQHANGYVTTYSHLVGYARGIKAGVRVRQGQVIGYVGSTGLSTGAHLHYEVIVNGNYVDPMRIRLARTKRLSSKQLAEFRRERERIDDLMAKASTAALVASRQTVN